MINDWQHSLFNSNLRKAGLLCAFGALAFLAAPGADAQTTTSKMPGLALSSDQPIQIESDKLEIHDAESQAVFTGNVKVVQGTTTMQAGKMTVFYKKKQPAADAAAKPATDNPVAKAAKEQNQSLVSGDANIDHILVTNKVYLVSGTQTATADDGSFDMANQLAVLKGQKVVLTDGPNVFTGCQLTVHMATGEAQLDACGGRVQIQLDPKSQQVQQQQQKKN
ncbi:LPS ABC transporter substrate-binding protein LptA [Agrobacterium sp. SHOUNA12C]|uniref:Organic solvent tolerance-like N-terminal domain-containing protein n=1 Tax=Rhizobium rhizogenes NBRC 13257 TaxID=1220581 RepID=A0AA87Q9L4_RHIRH|nr:MULTISPECIES: LptA/OstA family protein [Rhizobium]KAA6486989.1 LPS ABC transporter substrate-binding protein LptA [Agrobacterium sp. ICMP 7243]MCJ9724124.1 LPS ABC transporter substrate-binding protein LptA [Agrobacterium sp. BETTINA12B]MCJ9760216.1 LPS ABC transporter substrate-binding protein LptA [Agrobacterium sp. SHOUNA12C]OCI97898.1 cell division protein DivIVA [Agrobacterium sp. 13-626]OCJ21624.1 cell division protein DivIVA [Agrobacterium sp. B131/95]OCJ26929.1 cell division protei